MKITMISNAMSHHQVPFCEGLAGMEGVEFHFIATKPLTEERRGMGYSDLNYAAPYIIRSYENDQALKEASGLAENSDYVIFGSAPYTLIKRRLKNGSWTFLYSERIFKKAEYLPKLKLWMIYRFRYGRYARKKVNILCASAYGARDFHKVGFQQKQLYQWGYFPKESRVELSDLLEKKKPRSILWVGRMISWKHPETAIELAQRLKNGGISFHLTMIGNGVLFDTVKDQIKKLGLNDDVTLTGSMPAENVRRVMEQSEILISTSDQNEGWGAVINEAMSSACAVCASREMGAAPFLIQDGDNGFLYNWSDCDMLFERVKELLESSDLRMGMAKKATLTIRDEWNGENAAHKFVELCKNLQAGELDFAFPEGVCSRASVNIKA